MQFTRLRLNGFKSFVDPTDLLIRDGLTGIVGPNGCGKSNLLEALRWVMGETRPTAMRGGGMEDVIFAGTASRGARAFAEVSLTIADLDRRAPPGLDRTDGMEVVRRITRDGGSGYRAQGREIRARDVQMLFADAATGARSPSLVRQGQIAELIAARPQARRRILEEAAGIGGLHRRRHEAELKLRAAEANLERVEDRVGRLAAQRAGLARQARAARRYREIGTALRRAEWAILWHRWATADAMATRAAAARCGAMRAAEDAERAARAAAGHRGTTEAALPRLREDASGSQAALHRLDARIAVAVEGADRARRSIEGLDRRLSLIAADAAREVELTADAEGSIARLDAEAAALEAASEDEAARIPDAEEAARATAADLAERERALDAATGDMARLAAMRQAAQAQASDHGRRRRRAERDRNAARSAASVASEALAETAARREGAASGVATATEAADAAGRRLEAAEKERAAMQADQAEASVDLAAATGTLAAVEAEMRGVERPIAGDPGDVDPVADAVRVTPGFETALSAALSHDLSASLVDGDEGTGWAALPGVEAAASLPDGAEPLRPHVDVPAELERRIAHVGVVDARDGARLQSSLSPGQRLVSRDGGLWRWDGFRAAAGDGATAAAIRLTLRNRLDDLAAAARRASGVAEAARLRHDRATAASRDAGRTEGEARDARRDAEAAMAQARRREASASAAFAVAEGAGAAAAEAVARHEADARDAAAAASEAADALASLDAVEPLRAAAADLQAAVVGARAEMLTRRAAHDDLARAAEARSARRDALAAERASWNGRLATAAERLRELRDRRTRMEGDLATARDRPARADAELAALRAERSEVERCEGAARAALREGEAAAAAAADAERVSERAAGAAREARARAEAAAEAATGSTDRIAAEIAEATDGAAPADLLRALGGDAAALPAMAALEAETEALRTQRSALGAVNLRAEDDAEEIRAEHDALATERADLSHAIAALRDGVARLNRDGRERLLTAFEHVRAAFAILFGHLFGGGEARLELIESDDPLEAGLEILCQPPGKTVSTLDLLSGGEQTLCALALIFAVFLSNPSPICVLDEVDAPLDDANVARFCDMLDEMTRRTDTRFLVITHHPVTMARMDRLYGVTMAEPGVSQLVSVDLRRAERMVA